MVPPKGAGHRDSHVGDSALVSHELLERLAAHIHALRFGDGLEGLARGVGLRVVVAELPAGTVLEEDDGTVFLGRERTLALQRRAILREIALAALRHAALPATRTNALRLARVLDEREG